MILHKTKKSRLNDTEKVYSSDYAWLETHVSHILDEDLKEWFKRVDFKIDDVKYTKDSDQFQQALFWERLKA